jgi:hypothetical protein
MTFSKYKRSPLAQVKFFYLPYLLYVLYYIIIGQIGQLYVDIYIYIYIYVLDNIFVELDALCIIYLYIILLQTS